MTATQDHELAARPEDLSDLFLTRANARDVEGIVALYEPGAILALPGGGTVSGHREIRKFYTTLLAVRSSFGSRGQRAALRNGELALTSTRLPSGDTTVEVARCQPDGSWLWTIDQPALLSS
jgi:hypothetical protein